MSYVEEIDRLTAERDAARENALIRTGIARGLDRLNREEISELRAENANLRAERDRARDLAAHLEDETARVRAVLDDWREEGEIRDALVAAVKWRQS